MIAGLAVFCASTAPAMLIGCDAVWINPLPKPDLFTDGNIGEVSGWAGTWDADNNENSPTDLAPILFDGTQSALSKLMMLWGWQTGAESFSTEPMVAQSNCVTLSQPPQKPDGFQCKPLTAAGYYRPVPSYNLANRIRKTLRHLLGTRLLFLGVIALVAIGYYRTSQCFQIVHPLWLSTGRARIDIGGREHSGLSAWLRRCRL